MVLFVFASRSSDGLALVACTDGSHDETRSFELQETHRCLKMLSRRAAILPDRCQLMIEQYMIYFITALGLTFFVITDVSYPRVLAFSFLQEVQREFLQMYEKSEVERLRRPYALITFDRFIQKIKHRYNNPSSLTTRINMSDLTQEIRLRPPHELSLSDVYQSNNIKSEESHGRIVLPSRRYEPANLSCYLSMGLNILCAGLNLTRGVSVMNEGHIEDFDSEIMQYGMTFILLCFLSLYQVFLQVWLTRARLALACGTLGSICLCQLFLWEHRNNVQLFFHITVACFSTFSILTRREGQKSPEYSL